MNADRPPTWRASERISGVLGQRFARKKSRTSERESSVKYAVISSFVLRQVKYVYDCVNPSLARRYMTKGRVNASARKMTSGWASRIEPITHSQKGNALV